ncbi:hypothetical protein R6Z07M_011283 [Ovis aries]
MARSPKRLHVTREGAPRRGRGLEGRGLEGRSAPPLRWCGGRPQRERAGRFGSGGCGCLRACSAREDKPGASRPGRLPAQSQAARPSVSAGRPRPSRNDGCQWTPLGLCQAAGLSLREGSSLSPACSACYGRTRLLPPCLGTQGAQPQPRERKPGPPTPFHRGTLGTRPLPD